MWRFTRNDPRRQSVSRKASFRWHDEKIPNEFNEVPLDASFSDYFLPFRPKHLPLHPLSYTLHPHPKLLSRTFVRFNSMLTFLSGKLSAAFPTPNPKDNPVPALRDILFLVYTAAPHIWRYACADYCKFRTKYFRFPCQWMWWILSSGMSRHVVW